MDKELEGALEYVNGKIADLEDNLQHYTMVDKDKCREFYIREDLKQFTTIKQALQRLETIDKKRCGANVEKIIIDEFVPSNELDNAKPSEALNCIEKVNDYLKNVYDYKEIKEAVQKDINTVEQALQRLDKYEQILGSGRLTDRNYKNTTLDLDSCKPYVRLGQLEDIYEKGKKNE